MELPNFLLAGLNQLGGGIVVGPLAKGLGEEVCKPAWPVSVAIGASLKDVKTRGCRMSSLQLNFQGPLVFFAQKAFV